MNDLNRWHQLNEKYLEKALEWLRLRLRQLATGERDNNKSFFRINRPKREREFLNIEPVSKLELESAAKAMIQVAKADPQNPPALIYLGQKFGLSQFELNVLLLCVAMELDPRTAPLCAHIQGDGSKAYPTFALVLSLFDNVAWDVLSPHRPLRKWHLIEINQPPGKPLTASILQADDRILNYVKGLNYLDDRLAPLLVPMELSSVRLSLPNSHKKAAVDIINQLKNRSPNQLMSLVQLIGIDSFSKQLVASVVASHLGFSLWRLPFEMLPNNAGELETFARLWQRESRLLGNILYLDAFEQAGSLSEAQMSFLTRFLAISNDLMFLSTRELRRHSERPTIQITIDKPSPPEQQILWSEALGSQVDPKIAETLVGQFNLNMISIERISQTALAQTQQDEDLREKLWKACLASTCPQLDELAQRLDAKATLDDIVLLEREEQLLLQIIGQVQQRLTVYQAWGFQERMNRGFGINALFAGASGTGKTMAAEAIANALQLNLYRIDLSAVVSKYIGETEKNLRRLFDAAEDGGAILFFDEADALFGKRSEVKDSHDRYANIEIDYLLQRMEAYQGLAILATNMKSHLDKAFERRLRFIINFPFPGKAERQQIWQRAFPRQTPTNGLDFNWLARLNLAGGSIHNIALNAAFLAAQEQIPVTMPVVLKAAKNEFLKLDRSINEADFRYQIPVGAKL
ncbi:MAG: ATP-binding protein [Cyanobacteria bacterium P01_G01_bin.67]